MTEHTTRDGRRDDEHRARHRPTLGDLSHTNPRTGERFGDAMVYHRGPTVAADGGTERVEEGEPTEADDETLSDVEHTPPRDAADANGVHERGGEHDEEQSDDADEQV
ncbi:hypothetical protein [Halomarina oriensis]|uniref:Uncharacterized protein n=1 Tax=Halomarina oriensis TaxID=671145 RepID=A0A6B0GSS9_9EURY|nr:hypothetical protein [Halomarina oriensis]MWG35693.1 hypothetical protein [Halomarina oriensis]